ncbi:hypothetical protein LOAG_00085 [Loa loa]|uniref:Atos-like conserved domain-containing protein n=2 Tax=Loa loa TaxID=7209 RepID=A0A1S0UCA2_LOALO|nr:hypothetical protein LOAG_00085 [Loa loa]EFO28396.1 hypothetical protein LOAG_00085 [Loa loa]
MKLGLEITRLMIDSRHGDSKYIEQMLQRAPKIIETSSLLSMHTFLVHQQCFLKFSCTSIVLLEDWTIKIVPRLSINEKILDSMFLKNAIQSYLHFSQLSSQTTCSEEQLSNDTVCKYRIPMDDVCLCVQLRSFEIHGFPLGRLNSLSCVYVIVKWKKYNASPHLWSSKFARSLSEEWLLLSSILFGEKHFTASSSGIPVFYISFEYQRNSEMDGIEFESVRKSNASVYNTYNLKTAFYEQLLIKDSCACKSTHLHSGPRICRFFNFRNDVRATDEKMLLGNEQSVKLPTVENLLSASESSIETGSPLQAVPPSPASRRETLPRRSLISAFRFMSNASKAFSKSTGLPLNSSPAPFNRSETKFVRDLPVKSTRNKIIEKTAREETTAHILRNASMDEKDSNPSYYGSGCTRRSTSSNSGLLCNFEESALNGRLDPVTSLGGFHLQIAASDEACSPHLTLPVTTFFFNMPEDEAPLPYMGFCSLENMRKGYRIPRKGILQAVLFNPQGTVVRMFVVKFDVSDMPPSSQTFLRQRTFFMPVGCTCDDVLRSWLKYLIHISLATDRRGRLYVHTDIKMLFSQKNELETLNFELGKDMIKYQLQSFTEMPRNPKYSPRK